MVKLGKDKYLEDKMSRMVAILPQITGEKGILHMENITESSKTVTFEKEEEEVTAENWTGGYDEMVIIPVMVNTMKMAIM